MKNMLDKTKIQHLKILLGLMYLAGFIGLQVPVSRASFELLIPFNLVLSTLILLRLHKEWNLAFYSFFFISFLAGFGVEWLGVHSGLIFGEYAYGPSLGWKVDEIPLLIGLNWFLLLYLCGNLSQSWTKNLWGQSLIGAALMVLLDFWIEPVAIRHQMWFWVEESVPLQNYFAWFVVAFLLMMVYGLLKFKKENPLAKTLLLCQFLFFMSHNLTYLIFS